MENKKSRTGLHIFLGLILGIIICGGVLASSYFLGYLTFDTLDSVEEDIVSEETEVDEATLDSTTDNLGFDLTKITNALENTYVLSRSYDGITATLDDTKTVVTIGFYSNITEGFALYLPDGYDEEYFNTTKEIQFTKQLKDIYIGGFGEDLSNDTILFLMEDGTIEYLPIRNNLQTDPDNLKSYGTLSDLTDIVLFYSATKNGSGTTILAQASDGTIYDLQSIAGATGNY